MGETTGIAWAHSTFNPFWGCTELSPACDNCYARVLAARFGYEWGPNAPRRFFGDKHWNEPLRWNAKAEASGQPWRVFCASMADVFEQLPHDHPDRERMGVERARLWELIERTPALTWMLLTKRPGLAHLLTPDHWQTGWPRNVWALGTVENAEQARRRLPWILRIPAVVRGVSMEPLLERVDLRRVPTRQGTRFLDVLGGDYHNGAGEVLAPCPTIQWVITGGESGAKARASHPDWFRALRDECRTAGVAYFHKQWGEWVPEGHPAYQAPDVLLAGADGDDGEGNCVPMMRVGTKTAGHLLDGREWHEFPEAA